MKTLQERMAMTVAGQVTRSNPEATGNARCEACKYFSKIPTPTIKGDGRCRLVNAMTKREGVLFHGSNAYACSKFERRTANQ